MVGSIDYFEAKNQGQVNMAVAERQPGSSFKPITYLNAFLKGWSPATMVSDTPLRFVDELGRPWNPVNNDKIFRGMVPVRSALATSLNIPAARAILYAGVEPTLDLAHRMGITTLTRKGWYGPSLTLGGGEVRPLDLAFAYTVLANNGKLRGQLLPPGRQQPGFAELEPVTILKIEDSAGEVLEQFTHPEERQVVEAPYAYLVTDIMSDNDARTPAYGRNNSLILPDRPVAAKTGTTDSNQDNWTLGFTPNLVTAVWIGNTDNARMNAQALGGANAAPLWQAVMKAYHEGKPVERFVRPPGVVTAQVCAATGLLASSGCSVRRNEIFVAGRLPTRQPDQAMLVKYDKTTGKPATPETPPENIEERLQAPGEEGAGAGGAAVPGAVPGQPGAPASVPGLPDGWALPTPQTGVLQRPPGDIRTP
ncbi:MAG: penicillin-binding transpeptidase domain-containing protein [Chloroflexi bacterium]|nr:penicillin-binding transpeptidase domain-containing protein [Chloroflexota bacterium]